MPPLSIDSESIRSFTKNIHHSNAIRLMEKSILSAIFYMNAMKPTCKWVLNVVKTNERSAFVHHVIFTFILTYFSMNFSTRLKLRHLQSGHHKLWVTCLILHQSLSISFVYCFAVLCTKAKMIFQANGIDCAHDVYVNFFFRFCHFLTWSLCLATFQMTNCVIWYKYQAIIGRVGSSTMRWWLCIARELWNMQFIGKFLRIYPPLDSVERM